MKRIEHCDERTIEGLTRALRNVAIGKDVTFAFEAGMTRHREVNGEIVAVPNGTVTFRLYVNGGAVDLGEPAGETA